MSIRWNSLVGLLASGAVVFLLLLRIAIPVELTWGLEAHLWAWSLIAVVLVSVTACAVRVLKRDLGDQILYWRVALFFAALTAVCIILSLITANLWEGWSSGFRIGDRFLSLWLVVPLTTSLLTLGAVVLGSRGAAATT